MLGLVLFLASFGITALIFLPKVLANRNRSQAEILRGVQNIIRKESTGQYSQCDHERVAERAKTVVSQYSAAEDVQTTDAAQRKDSGEAAGDVVAHSSSVAEIRRRAAASMQKASAMAESPSGQDDNDPTIEEIRKLLTLKEGAKDDTTTLEEIRRLLCMSKLACHNEDADRPSDG